MTLDTAPGRSAWPVRALGAWLDGANSGRATVILLAAFVALWTAFQTISYASLDLHPDLTEVWAWGRHPAWGYYKHPPLGGWMTAAWFAVFPATDWAFQLLATTNAAAALFVIDRIAARYVSDEKRVLVLLLLMLTPFYQFHGQRFASNQTLLLAWPLAVLCFLRAFESRRIAWSIAAGVACALAMLGKYFSIYLIAGIVIAALAHPDRWRYLKSASPWVSIAAGAVVLAPHVHWLATTGYQPFAYADARFAGATTAAVLGRAATYLAGGLGYVALPVLVWAAIARPTLATLRRTFWPDDPDRRMLVLLLVLPLALPALTSPITRVELTPLWTMSGWFLLPIVLLAPDETHVSRAATLRVAAAVLIFTLVMLIAAPALALQRHWETSKEGRAYFSPLAAEIAREWNAATGRRLSIVMGGVRHVDSIGFYHPDHPDSVPDFVLSRAPWVTPDRLAREGFVGVCEGADRGCRATLDRLAATEPDARIVDLTVTRRFWGDTKRPEAFRILIVPPQQGPRSASR